jgi:DNA-binding MarR family transcriptional regulator
MTRTAARRPPEETPAEDEIVGRIDNLLHQLVERHPARLSVQQAAILAHEARRKRKAFFGGREVNDGAWDILLDLFVAHFEKRKMTISSACVAAGLPSSTGMRYISHLESVGLLTRSRYPSYARSVFIKISDLGVEKLTDYFSEVARAAETLVE